MELKKVEMKKIHEDFEIDDWIDEEDLEDEEEEEE